MITEQADEIKYETLHKTLLGQLSSRQKQYLELISNDNCSEQKQQRLNPSRIIVHYTFESGSMLQFQRELRRLWEQFYVYPGSPMNNIRLKIETRSNKSLCQLLVKKKPHKKLLTDST